jgi:hypothetical protein
MALRTPPSWLQNGSHPAENDRLTATGVLYRSGGVADYASMKVTPLGTPGMAVNVSAGHAIIAGTQTSTQGFYIAYNDATTSVSVATANPTNPRIDLIVVTVQDAYYGGTSNNQVIFQAVTGTPSGSPVPPTAPDNSIVLAHVAVAAGTTAITLANITDYRVQAQFSESAFTTQDVSSNTVIINAIAAQTGKALRVNDSTGVQKFAIGVNGTLTFADGTNQTTAATFDPNIVINTQSGTTYNLVAGDAQKLVTLSNAATITLTIDSNTVANLPTGTQITVAQYGVGQVTIKGASSPSPVTIVSTGANPAEPKLRTKYSTATLLQTSTDNWLCIGDIV